MWRFLFSFYRYIMKLLKRLAMNAPESTYERIIFDAVYATGSQLKKGLA